MFSPSWPVVVNIFVWLIIITERGGGVGVGVVMITSIWIVKNCLHLSLLSNEPCHSPVTNIFAAEMETTTTSKSNVLAHSEIENNMLYITTQFDYHDLDFGLPSRKNSYFQVHSFTVDSNYRTALLV